MSNSGSLRFSLGEDLVAGLLEDFRPRIVVAIDAVAEAVEPEGVGLVLGLADALFRREPALVDPLEHLHHLDVGPAVQRPPQRADARRARGEQVGPGRAHHPHRRRAAILLVVGVEDEDQVQRVLDLRRDDVLLVGQREHHVQEVGAVAEVRVGIDERQPLRAAVGEGGDGADLADQPGGRLLQRLLVLDGEELLVETGQVAQRGRKDGHRRGVGRDVLELVLHALVQQLVVGQQAAELGPTRRGLGRRPKISSQATSTKLGLSVNCSMGMPR